MEKYLKIGERYVQWIALGLGGLYFVLMGFFYVAQPPITVEVDKKSYLPGEVDQFIKQTAVAGIEQDIKGKAWEHLQTGDTVAVLQKDLDRPPIDVRTNRAPGVVVRGGEAPATQSTQAFALVKPPAPEPANVTPAVGTAVLNVPQPAPAPPAGGAAADAPAAAPAAPVLPVVEQQDHDWNSYAWTVNAKALDKAFQAANIGALPPALYVTTFLRVEVVRQELLPNGQWGPAKVLPDIPTLTAPPISMPPMPLETADPEEKKNYLAWATTNVGAILTPPFFDVAYGTRWYVPGTEKPADSFVPLGPAPGAGAPIPATPGGVAPGGIAPGGLLPGTPAGLRSGVHAAGGPSLAPPAGGIAPHYDRPPAAAVTPGGMLPGIPVPGAPGQGGAAGVAGPINPALATDITLYTHDWNVEPGHVYHYKMRYWISNPLFQVQQAAVKAAERNALALPSPYSQWTASVEIPSRFKFWVQKFQRGTNDVAIDMFIRKPGVPGGLERSTVHVSPGDAIGSSAWLLVDIRQDPGRRNINYYYFLISDPAGHVERRDVEHDSKDPVHLEMLDRTGAAAAAGAGG